MPKISERLGQIQFNTRISVAESDIFNLAKLKVIKKIDSTKNFFSIHPTVIVADPFMLPHKDELYLFYEEQIGLLGKGVIKMIKTNDLKQKSQTIFRKKYKTKIPFCERIKNLEKIRNSEKIRNKV